MIKWNRFLLCWSYHDALANRSTLITLPSPAPMAEMNIVATIRSYGRIAILTLFSLLFNRYAAFLLGVYAYSLVILLLGGLGGVLQVTEIESIMVFHLDEIRGVRMMREYWELLLLFYLYCYFNMILRPSRLRALLAALPLFLAYIGQDIYFLMYSNVFRVAELSEVPELLQVLSWPYLALLLVLVVLPLGYFVWSINYRKPLPLLVGAVPLAVVIATAVYSPAKYIDYYNKVGEEIIYWSDAESVVNNGRFMMLLYREAERQLSLIKTQTYRNREQYRQQNEKFAGWIKANSVKRNVHLVVLESFIDPTLFKNVTYSQDPFHPSFRKLFGNIIPYIIKRIGWHAARLVQVPEHFGCLDAGIAVKSRLFVDGNKLPAVCR